jgi:D-glycero-D-manno-heptose 1,7-bisphosphate phosphatase
MPSKAPKLLPLPKFYRMPAKNKAIFLDRDGVLNREMGDYVCRFEDFHLLDNFDVLKTLQNRGYLLLVATNQVGLAKGWYSEDELAKMHAYLKAEYKKRGIEISDIFYCPHHPDFTGDCDCRKPKPGLLLQGIEKYNIDPAKSYFIGDRERDMEAAAAAGVRGILVDSDQPLSEVLGMIA